MKYAVLLLLLLTIVDFSVEAHPLKMAYTSVKYNSQKKVFEISHRVFQDDFENTLKANYHYSGDVYIQQNTAVTQAAVNRFFEKNFSISFNNKKAKLKYLKTEQKHQMGVIVWYETEKIDASNVRSVSIYNYIMMESFSEQVNMFNLNINEEVKRTLKFETDKIRETITI